MNIKNNNLTDYAKMIHVNTKDLTFYNILCWYKWLIQINVKTNKFN